MWVGANVTRMVCHQLANYNTGNLTPNTLTPKHSLTPAEQERDVSLQASGGAYNVDGCKCPQGWVRHQLANYNTGNLTTGSSKHTYSKAFLDIRIIVPILSLKTHVVWHGCSACV